MTDNINILCTKYTYSVYGFVFTHNVADIFVQN